MIRTYFHKAALVFPRYSQPSKVQGKSLSSLWVHVWVFKEYALSVTNWHPSKGHGKRFASEECTVSWWFSNEFLENLEKIWSKITSHTRIFTTSYNEKPKNCSKKSYVLKIYVGAHTSKNMVVQHKFLIRKSGRNSTRTQKLHRSVSKLNQVPATKLFAFSLHLYSGDVFDFILQFYRIERFWNNWKCQLELYI